MALSKIEADSLDLTDNFAFTGTVTGAGAITASSTAPSEGGATTTNVVQGLAKAWACFDQTTTQSFYDSFNCSSLTDNGGGVSTIAYTNIFNNDGYSSTGMAGKTGTRVRIDSVGASAKSSTGQQLYVSTPVPVATDGDDCNVTCHGDLA